MATAATRPTSKIVSGSATMTYLVVNLFLAAILVVIVFFARKAGGVMYAGPLGGLALASIIGWLIVALLPMRDRAGPLSSIHYLWIALAALFFFSLMGVDIGWFGYR